jgi:hypothetical protein
MTVGAYSKLKKTFCDSAFLPDDLARPQTQGLKVLDTLDTRFCSRCTVTSLASLPIISHSSERMETRRKSIKANLEFWFLLFSLLLVWLLRHC